MPHMSQGDALTLAGFYTTIAEDLVEYQADHGQDEDVDQIQLSNMVSALTLHARSLVNDAVATAFNDSAAAVQQLQKATSDAADEVASLKDEVGQFTRIASIATGIINIGAGLATHNAEATIKAAISLGTTLTKK